MVDSIGSAFLQNTNSKADTSRQLFEDNSTMYLELFLTQLKNQDPTEPYDTAEMTQQLSQLNTSEQLIDVNDNLESLLAANSTSQAASVSSFINKDVKYVSDTVFTNGQSVSEISYILDKSFDNVTIEVRDEFGELVNKTEGNVTEGSHSLFWDGTDTSGNNVPEGNYSIKVYTDSGSGELGTATSLVSGIVSGVDFSKGGEPILRVGYGDNATEIELKDVAAINDFNAVNNNNNNNS